MQSPKLTTVVVTGEVQVNHALREIGLTRGIVRDVVDAAVGARADALAVDPNGTPGLLSYIHGVRAIRLKLLPISGWRESRSGNVESTVNDKLGVQICFQNVDRACSDDPPQAISGKGSASRDLVQRGLFDTVADLETETGKIGRLPTVWMICVSADDNSVCAEVSCPNAFDGNQFDGFARRLFVINETIEPKLAKRIDSEKDSDIEFDIQVSKK